MKMMRSSLGCIALASLLLAACGDDGGTNGHADAAPVNCATEDRADPYVAGMTAEGSAGYSVKLVQSTPAPPAKGDNTWELQLLDGTTPVDGATLELVPFMPDHGHGTPIGAEVTAGGSDGMYTATPVNLWMPGYWEVTVNITDGSNTDSVVFKTCIDG